MISNKKLTYKKSDKKIKLILDKNVMSEVYALHALYPKKEWSGYVFYDITGDIDDPENMELITCAFVLQDLGSAAYTEFNVTTDIWDIYDKFPHLLGKAAGYLHSH